MILKYKLSEISNGKVSDKTLKSCDEGARATQNLMIETAWIVNKWLVPLMWFLTRFYKRKITKAAIEYDFYLIK